MHRVDRAEHQTALSAKKNKLLQSGINVAPLINVALENLAKRISVVPFIPYTYNTKIGSMESGIRPQPLEKSQKINKRRAMFIPDSRVGILDLVRVGQY